MTTYEIEIDDNSNGSAGRAVAVWSGEDRAAAVAEYAGLRDDDVRSRVQSADGSWTVSLLRVDDEGAEAVECRTVEAAAETAAETAPEVEWVVVHPHGTEPSDQLCGHDIEGPWATRAEALAEMERQGVEWVATWTRGATLHLESPADE